MSEASAQAHLRSTRTLTFVALAVLVAAAVVGAVLSVLAFSAAGIATGKANISKGLAVTADHQLTDMRATVATMHERYSDAQAALQVFSDKYGPAGLALIQQATSGPNPPAALVNERKMFEAANQAVEVEYGNLNAAEEEVTQAQAELRAANARARAEASVAQESTAQAWITVGVSAGIVAVLLIVFLYARTTYTAARVSMPSPTVASPGEDA